MGNKRKLEVITISSDDDDDDVPLTLIGTKSCSDTASGLKSYCMQQCEFCDKVFTNKYDMLIHNAKHIIIPLLKQSAHQCTVCLFYFTSRKELKDHMKHTHNVKLESTDNETKAKHVEVKTKHENGKTDKPILQLKDFSIVIDADLVKTTHEAIENRIRNRLRFEDDTDGNVDSSASLLNDLTQECKVNMNLFDEPWVGADVTEAKASKAVQVEKVDTIDVLSNDGDKYAASTHFDELVEPGMYRCKRCQQIFSTRFQLIQHDMTHIKIRKPRPLLCEFCERFISTSRLQLKQHLMKHSPDLWNHKQRMHTTCGKCGLKYHSYKKHVENYHELMYCHLCYKGFDSDEERLDHIREHLVETKCTQCDLVSTAIEISEHQRLCHKFQHTSTIKICETCSLFTKNSHGIKYVFLKNISEIGTRLTCERCKKQFFELKLVRRFHKAGYKERDGGEKKKCLSNTDRLKNIQQRLKMINKLSRFYGVVLFLSPFCNLGSHR